jgi:hypothetical protein
MPFYLRSPEQQPFSQDNAQDNSQDDSQDHILDKGKSKQAPEVLDKDTHTDQTSAQIQDSMAPKSAYCESSRSSSEEDRVHCGSRKEHRSGSKTSAAKRPVDIIHHNASSGEPKRLSSIDSKRWK